MPPSAETHPVRPPALVETALVEVLGHTHALAAELHDGAEATPQPSHGEAALSLMQRPDTPA